MGPVLRAVVGDTLKVTFKNMLPAGSAAVSLHPHGVLYDKSSEGSPYADGLPREQIFCRPRADLLSCPAEAHGSKRASDDEALVGCAHLPHPVGSDCSKPTMFEDSFENIEVVSWLKHWLFDNKCHLSFLVRSRWRVLPVPSFPQLPLETMSCRASLSYTPGG
jgi:hypothetical protein